MNPVTAAANRTAEDDLHDDVAGDDAPEAFAPAPARPPIDDHPGERPRLVQGAPKRVLVLANPKARSGTLQVDKALETMGGAGIDLIPVYTKSPNDLPELIEEARNDVDAVVVAGGDGTLNAAARGILSTGLPLGLLPTGTANDLARTLGIPTDLAAAAAVITAGFKRRIDIGEVNGHPFFNVASLGLSAELAGGLTREGKRRWGQLSYAIAALKVLTRARSFTAEILEEGMSYRVKTLQIAVGNGRYYGGGMAVEENAAIDDHHLDLYSLELSGVWKLAALAPWFRAGRHGLWQEVRTARGREFEVRTRKPRPINTDGELVTFTPARFEVRPGAVTVFAPKREDGPERTRIRG
jgi:YegS/Rv2252/BmrU family lipid kinase